MREVDSIVRRPLHCARRIIFGGEQIRVTITAQSQIVEGRDTLEIAGEVNLAGAVQCHSVGGIITGATGLPYPEDTPGVVVFGEERIVTPVTRQREPAA